MPVYDNNYTGNTRAIQEKRVTGYVKRVYTLELNMKRVFGVMCG